jgi:hypothetical protein
VKEEYWNQDSLEEGTQSLVCSLEEMSIFFESGWLVSPAAGCFSLTLFGSGSGWCSPLLWILLVVVRPAFSHFVSSALFL